MNPTITLPSGIKIEADSVTELLQVVDALYPPLPTAGFPGVDIDAIHFKLGAIRSAESRNDSKGQG